MSRYGKLSYLMRTGATLMFLGNLLVMALQFSDSEWKYFVYVIPANLGQGVVYPAILFTFLAAFGHDGTPASCSNSTLVLIFLCGVLMSGLEPFRPRRVRLNRLPNPQPRHRLRRRHHIDNRAEPPRASLTGRPARSAG
jgi:hypothetical protein